MWILWSAVFETFKDAQGMKIPGVSLLFHLIQPAGQVVGITEGIITKPMFSKDTHCHSNQQTD